MQLEFVLKQQVELKVTMLLYQEQRLPELYLLVKYSIKVKATKRLKLMEVKQAQQQELVRDLLTIPKSLYLLQRVNFVLN